MGEVFLAADRLKRIMQPRKPSMRLRPATIISAAPGVSINITLAFVFNPSAAM